MRGAPACLVHTSNVGVHTSSRNSDTGFYNDAPDVLDNRRQPYCRVVVVVSFDAYGGVFLREFEPWCFLILSAVINRAAMRIAVLLFKLRSRRCSVFSVKSITANLIRIAERGKAPQRPRFARREQENPESLLQLASDLKDRPQRSPPSQFRK